MMQQCTGLLRCGEMSPNTLHQIVFNVLWWGEKKIHHLEQSLSNMITALLSSPAESTAAEAYKISRQRKKITVNMPMPLYSSQQQQRP